MQKKSEIWKISKIVGLEVAGLTHSISFLFTISIQLTERESDFTIKIENVVKIQFFKFEIQLDNIRTRSYSLVTN